MQLQQLAQNSNDTDYGLKQSHLANDLLSKVITSIDNDLVMNGGSMKESEKRTNE